MEFRHFVFLVFLGSGLYVYFRGKVRFGLVRSLTDYVVLLAPINTMVYLFSKVDRTPYLSADQFPELKPLKDHWQMIREEALSLNEGGQIAAATGYNDIGFNSFFEPDGSASISIGTEKICLRQKNLAPKQLPYLNRFHLLRRQCLLLCHPGLN